MRWRRLLKSFREAPRDPPARRQLALAVLLLETARADFEHAPAELDAIRRELVGRLQVPEAEIDALLGEARDAARQAVSLHDYVATLNRELDQDEKAAVIGVLWRVAHADGRIDPHEEHLIRRLAELLHLPHRSFIQGKLEAGGP